MPAISKNKKLSVWVSHFAIYTNHSFNLLTINPQRNDTCMFMWEAAILRPENNIRFMPTNAIYLAYVSKYFVE